MAKYTCDGDDCGKDAEWKRHRFRYCVECLIKHLDREDVIQPSGNRPDYSTR